MKVGVAIAELGYAADGLRPRLIPDVCAGHVFTLGGVSPLSRLGRPKDK
jgi:hypothetical protein